MHQCKQRRPASLLVFCISFQLNIHVPFRLPELKLELELELYFGIDLHLHHAGTPYFKAAPMPMIFGQLSNQWQITMLRRNLQVAKVPSYSNPVLQQLAARSRSCAHRAGQPYPAHQCCTGLKLDAVKTMEVNCCVLHQAFEYSVDHDSSAAHYQRNPWI